MTILPKKKVTKEKNENENVDHNIPHHSHSRHHPSTSDSRHDKVARARTALPAGSREDVHPSHDPGNTYDPLESNSGHNKRRHRSSPHRNHSRKHRGGHSAHTHPPVPTPNNPQQNVSYEDDDVRHNSDDEHVPPAHPENIEEVNNFSVI